MASFISFVLFCLIIEQLGLTAVVQYVMDSPVPLDLSVANLKLLSFNLFPNWVDFTLEYTQSEGSIQDSQWFGMGFGNNQMPCTYAITFEPQLDTSNNTVTSVIVTERQLGNHNRGRTLERRLAFVETWIVQDPLLSIRARLVREREVPFNESLAPTNISDFCSNLGGYYQFPFEDVDLNIIYAKGVNGERSLAYHTPPNRATSSVPLVGITDGINTTLNQTCPSSLALHNYTYAQRFSDPNVVRVCNSCGTRNTTVGTTLVPLTTTFLPSMMNESTHDCILLESENFTVPGVCGCSIPPSKNMSMIFLVDGGYQDDTEWREFTLKILEGFLHDIMLNMTDMDVNVVVYGGINFPLEVQKLDSSYLNNISSNPVPIPEREFSNLCNATNFAIDYLMNSNKTDHILVTIPWQSPTDELDCLICNNCSSVEIHSFTAKVFDKIDLSLVEQTFGPYGNCTYLYENSSELQTEAPEWLYVLAAISDFVCTEMSTVPPQITFEANFSMVLVMKSRFTKDMLTKNYTSDIVNLIEESFELATNYSLVESRDFIVTFESVNITGAPQPPGLIVNKTNALINVRVLGRNEVIISRLEQVAEGRVFGRFLNDSFNDFFPEAEISIGVFSIDGVPLNITTTLVPETTALIETTEVLETTPIVIETTPVVIETTPVVIETTPVVIETTPVVIETTPVVIETTGTAPVSEESAVSIEIVPWMIAVIVIGGIIFLALCIGMCVFLMRNNSDKKGCQSVDNKESVPMITTSTMTHQVTCVEPANKPERVPQDDVYV